MAPEQTGNSSEHNPLESMIDDLIRDILSESGQTTKARARGVDPMASLIESALASTSRTASKASPMERLLLTQVLSSALADALAPALADVLAPEIMKSLEHHLSPSPASGVASTRSTAAKGGAGSRRKT
ncbi:hypothetical protein ACIBQ1_55140 [Nonomuraea sp. NPDC050153]|uniref:hypothetical protein n=1 Tax=Nonomuraea sp. NPDC050153 TaxID=3364359 RepID=UPI0037A301EC